MPPHLCFNMSEMRIKWSMIKWFWKSEMNKIIMVWCNFICLYKLSFFLRTSFLWLSPSDSLHFLYDSLEVINVGYKSIVVLVQFVFVWGMWCCFWVVKAIFKGKEHLTIYEYLYLHFQGTIIFTWERSKYWNMGCQSVPEEFSIPNTHKVLVPKTVVLPTHVYSLSNFVLEPGLYPISSCDQLISWGGSI